MISDEGSHLDGYTRDGGSRQVEAPPTENHRRIVKAMQIIMLILQIHCNPQHQSNLSKGVKGARLHCS